MSSNGMRNKNETNYKLVSGTETAVIAPREEEFDRTEEGRELVRAHESVWSSITAEEATGQRCEEANVKNVPLTGHVVVRGVELTDSFVLDVEFGRLDVALTGGVCTIGTSIAVCCWVGVDEGRPGKTPVALIGLW